MKVKSPLTGSFKTKHEKDIPTSLIKKKYLERFNIDVSPYFGSLDKISIFIDEETGYRFYYPLSVAGDDKFYEKLQENDWYYMPWKWEHRKCTELIEPGSRVLEVGCARGDFLNKLQEIKDVQTVGLELNQSAVNVGQQKGLDIIREFVEDHAKKNPDTYDVVCSFQVLEHISEVQSFIKACIGCLKRGGKIIFSVPNNGSFIKYDWEGGLLNMPPHHMGLWDEKAFRSVAPLFDIHLLKVYFEPLQDYHLKWYINILERRFLKNRLLKIVYAKLNLKPQLIKVVESNSQKIHGHSIMAVYTKN